MRAFFKITVFSLLLACIPWIWVSADDRHDWLEESWWNEGILPVPTNYPVQTFREPVATDHVDYDLFIARPDAEGEFPGVLFVHGRRGVDELIQGHIRRLAARGFVVYAPDLFEARFINPMPLEHDYVLESDLNDVLDHVLVHGQHHGDQVCVYSHTRGGYYALKLAVTFSRQNNGLACFVSYYPHMQDPNAPEPMQVYQYAPEADSLQIPALLFVGTEEQYQRKRGIDTAVRSMQSRGLPVQLVTYPGVGRGFDFREPPMRTFADDLATRDALFRSARFMHHILDPEQSQ